MSKIYRTGADVRAILSGANTAASTLPYVNSTPFLVSSVRGYAIDAKLQTKHRLKIAKPTKAYTS